MHHLPGLTWQQTMKMENAGSYAIEKVIIKGEQSYATSVRREREREMSERMRENSHSSGQRLVMLHPISFASTMECKLCLLPAITGRSKNAQPTGGDVNMSINGFALPNVVNINTCADRRAERRHWAVLPGWRMLGWWCWGCGGVKHPPWEATWSL